MQRKEILLALDLLLCQNRSFVVPPVSVYQERFYFVNIHSGSFITSLHATHSYTSTISQTILGLFRIEEDAGTGILLKSGECFLLQRSL